MQDDSSWDVRTLLRNGLQGTSRPEPGSYVHAAHGMPPAGNTQHRRLSQLLGTSADDTPTAEDVPEELTLVSSSSLICFHICLKSVHGKLQKLLESCSCAVDASDHMLL